MKAAVLNTLGKKVKTVELSDAVFNAEYNEPLIHQVVVAQLANKRQGTKSALTRTEVRGGGIKPWRQKGTGRARQGSIRAPQWTHGGVVFAPKPRDFSKKINKKMRDGAMVSAISKKFRDGDVIILDKVVLENNKTKEVAAILKNLGVDKTAMLVTVDANEGILRASRNIAELTIASYSPADAQNAVRVNINVYDVVRVNKCIFTLDAVKAVEEAYGNE